MTKRVISLLLVLVSLFSIFSLAASAATYYLYYPAEGDYQIAARNNNNYAIDVSGAVFQEWQPIHLYSRSGSNTAQIWTLKRQGSSEWYRIIHTASGLCLNVRSGSDANDARLMLYRSSDNTAASFFRFISWQGHVLIQSKLPGGRVIDLNNGICTNCNVVHLWDFHDGNSAQWDLYTYKNAKRTGYVNTSSQNLLLRSLPNGSSTVLASMPKGAALTVLDGSTDFSGYYRVQYGNTIGFASKQYISWSAPQQQTYTGYVKTSGSNLNLRSGASTSYKVLVSMPNGSALTVLDNKTQTNGFYHVKYNGYTGYASASYITFTKPQTQNKLVSDSAISSAAKTYGISTSSNAYKALQSINNYYSKLSGNKNGVNVFLFEGVGTTSSTSSRRNAMCVVVKNGSINYVNLSCGTLPDYPFNPAKNGSTPMPTIKDGVYGFTTCNHRGSYAALNITSANVVRFRSKTNYYSSTSSGINVHCRSSLYNAASNDSWVNSAGCQLIGANTTEYLKFIKAVGIVPSSATCNSKTSSLPTYKTYVTGKIVIDRAYAYNYMSNIGYSANAISLIRGY